MSNDPSKTEVERTKLVKQKIRESNKEFIDKYNNAIQEYMHSNEQKVCDTHPDYEKEYYRLLEQNKKLHKANKSLKNIIIKLIEVIQCEEELANNE